MAVEIAAPIEASKRQMKPQPASPGLQPSASSTDRARPVLRLVFKYVNNYFMVPVFRLGFGWAIGSPPGGYIMVLKTTGKESGKTRYAPVNYAIIDGNVYCIAGWGRTCHWFANMKANPHVEVLMPGGSLAGIAEEVTDPQEARRAMLSVLRNAGFATLFGGLNPLTISDEQLTERVVHAPVVRIRPTGLGNGPYDPGGWGWVPPVLAQMIGLIWLVGRARHRKKLARIS